MSDEGDPSISPEYRERDPPIREMALSPLSLFDIGADHPEIDIHTGEHGGVHITGTEAAAPWPGPGNCPQMPGNPHLAATPPWSDNWSLLTYNFADGTGIRLRLCAQCSGIFWERTSA